MLESINSAAIRTIIAHQLRACTGSVGSGISELRIDYGPGYRVYYLQEGQRLIVLLCGGGKSSQDRDIEQAHRIAEEWKNDDQDD